MLCFRLFVCVCVCVCVLLCEEDTLWPDRAHTHSDRHRDTATGVFCMSLIFHLAAETAASIAHYGAHTTKQLADNNNFWNVAIEQDDPSGLKSQL